MQLPTFAKRVINYPDQQIPSVSSKDWLAQGKVNPVTAVKSYLLSLFPFLQWFTRYNLGWATGDLIAGLTVGMVLVPQSMSYAQIATLAPEYGLYSSFVGVFIYCFFATSKDVSIGPVAVMSLTVAQIIKSVQAHHGNEWLGPQIATTLAFICGFIVLGIGLLRLGWIVEFIPAPAVSGFMTGSAINIVAGQVPGLMGISGFDTRAATYKVVINTLKGLPRTTKDAAFGLVGLATLITIKFTCERLAQRYPRRERIFFFISVLRHAFVILVLTIAAWLYTRHRVDKKGNYPIKILKTVPRGFKHVGQPTIDRSLLAALAPKLPVATIILLLEHISISKSFGRVNGYTINPNQELIAIGVTNTIGTLFSAYPATGSFSRSALKAKSGVRTPAAGWITGIVVIVALYGLTSAFFWIPSAGLSAVIIHAVADLVASPDQVYSFWRVSPLEFFIWAAAVLVTVFVTIEAGIYTSIAASLVLLLLRMSFPRGKFLGRLTINSGAPGEPSREVFVPLDQKHGPNALNTQLVVQPPSPGVIIYRFEEGVLYPNCHRLNTELIGRVKAVTRRGKDMSKVPLSQRPWNDPGPPRGHEDTAALDDHKPYLRAVVLDFSSVTHIDTTGVQLLIDTRTEMLKWADAPVEFHFASIHSPWIRRALIAGAFGIGQPQGEVPREVAAIAPIGGRFDDSPPPKTRLGDEEGGFGAGFKSGTSSISSNRQHDQGPLVATDTPFFHFDLATAVHAADAAAGFGVRPETHLIDEKPLDNEIIH